MASSQVYYRAEKTRLENRGPSRNACLYIRVPPVSLFIDTPQCLFISVSSERANVPLEQLSQSEGCEGWLPPFFLFF